MKPTKCKNCGASDFVRKGDKYVCKYCGEEYPIPEEELKKEEKLNVAKDNQNSSSSNRFQYTPSSREPQKTGYVDATPKKTEKKKLSRTSQTLIVVIIFVAVVACISILNGPDDEDNNATVMAETETVKEVTETFATEKETEAEAQMKETEDIDVFGYNISGNEVKLTSYNGDSDFLEISPTYTVDGIEYNTDVTNFKLGSHNFDTIIFDEGITEIYLLAFSDTCSKQVYLPSTLTYIYDKTLSYLREDREGGIVQVYYGGTEEQWNSIYTEYDRSQVSQDEAAAELGTSLADTINKIIEDGSGDAEFEYHFNASPDDLKK